MDLVKRAKKTESGTCAICYVPHDRQHYRGAFHKRMVEKRRRHKAATDQFKTLEEKIEAMGDKEPFVGLEYISQCSQDVNGIIIYHCKLCKLFGNAKQCFIHVTAPPHRIMYLRNKGQVGKRFRCNTVDKCEEILHKCYDAEKTYGRHKIRLAEKALFPFPASVQHGDSKSFPGVGKQSNNRFVNCNAPASGDGPNSRSTIHDGGTTFLELKSAYEAKLRAERYSSAGGTMVVQGTDCDMDSFWCNEELFDFLDNYSIESNDDFTFVQEVIQSLTKALEQHKRLADLKRLIANNRKRLGDTKKNDLPQSLPGPLLEHSNSTQSLRVIEPAGDGMNSNKLHSQASVNSPKSKKKKKPPQAPAARVPQQNNKVRRIQKQWPAAKAQLGNQGPANKPKRHRGSRGKRGGRKGKTQQILATFFSKQKPPPVPEIVRYPDSVVNRNKQHPWFPGSQIPGPGSHYNKNQQKPGPPFSSQNTFYEQTPPTGQGAVKHEEPGSHYNQNQWNPGPQFTSQNSFLEPTPPTGQGAGKHEGADHPYNQHQQAPAPQFENRGPYTEPRFFSGPGADRSQEPRSHHLPDSIGLPSDMKHGQWPSQVPPSAGSFSMVTTKAIYWQAPQSNAGPTKL